MDRCAACTSRKAIADCSLDAKENHEPVHVQSTAKFIVSADNEHKIGKRSSPNDSSIRKHRRGLHDIDANRPRRPVHLPRCALPTDSSRVTKDPIDVKKTRGKVTTTTSSEAFNEAITVNGGVVKGYKGLATAAEDAVDSNRQLGHQESENLAWMDMMLALLEKRYDANSTLPVCVTDLEASNAFQLPEKKKIKTVTTSVQVSFKSRSRLDAASVMNDSKKSVTTSEQSSQEQTKEGKRQRLLLRYAQQIQASTVSSFTSCGCKTGCLKMYCMCFSSRGFCHAGCACDDCKNKNGRTNQSERVEAIQNYIANDPSAFSIASPLPQDANATGFLHLLPQKSSLVVLRGCRCKKSKCSKKYCECFQHGIACTSHCRNMDCCNQCETSHLSKAFIHGKRAHYESTRTLSPGVKPFHPVQITVTKQPRRNCVGKTLRLNL